MSRSRSRSFCFTAFEVADHFGPSIHFDFPYIESIVFDSLYEHASFMYCIYQYEVAPITGAPHIQGFVHFSNPVDMSVVMRLLTPIHLEKIKGSVGRNIHYCSKPVPECKCSDCSEAQRIDGPYEVGTRPESLGQLGDWSVIVPHSKVDKKKSVGVLAAVIKLVDEGKSNVDIVRLYPSALRLQREMDKYRQDITPDRDHNVTPIVSILWGAMGSGKTRYVFDTHGVSNVFKVPLPTDSGICWFDGYKGEEVTLIDDWPLEDHDRLYYILLEICDRFKLSLPVKGAFVKFVSRYVYITSNSSPSAWFNGKGLQSLTRRITGGVGFVDHNEPVYFNGLGPVPYAP